MPITNYLKELKKQYSPESREHTYRTQLENLWNEFYKGSFDIYQESATSKGTPDFTVKNKNEQIIGFVECKDIDVDIKAVLDGKKSYKKEYDQLLKYLTIAPVVIYTNYISFYLVAMNDNKIIVLKECVLLDKITNKTATNEESLKKLFESFVHSEAQAITNQNAFINLLARRTKILRDEITLECEDPDSYFKNSIKELFNKTIFKELDDKDFADSFAQIITFGLLFYRLTEQKNVSLQTLHSMPKYIPIFQELLRIFDVSSCSKIIAYSIDSIINGINAYDDEMFRNALSYDIIHDSIKEDPFIYMYENFLKEFDPKVRNARGVFYTPIEAVRYIVSSIDEVLKSRLDLGRGLLDESVHILDFATGTGTFLLGTIEHIYRSLETSNNQGMWQSQVSNFILKQLYGFEFLVVPYVLAHFRIHEYLNACNYEYKDKDRLQLFLTNTLDNTANETVPMFPKMNEEADMAYKIKNESPILVIMGNPPYNNKSDAMNSKEWIMKQTEVYKENLNEKKINLNDDYIKFMRFAHWKMENIDKGVFSLIVNNGFINGITHREMRNKLMQTFDEIYIYDLHGNINKGEKCSDGTMDFNIFDIKDVGVCIAIFIKTGKKDNPNKGVYFQEVYGSQSYKKQNLMDKSWNEDIKDNKWIKLKDDPKWHWFTPVTADVQYWSEFIGVQEIFATISSGVQTLRDHITIHLNKNELNNVINDFKNLSETELYSKYDTQDSRDWQMSNAIADIKKSSANFGDSLITNIHYRPFDFRYTYYTGISRGFIGTPCKSIEKSFINKDNIGLVFTRKNRQITNGYFFITEFMIDRHGLDSAGDSMVVSPLYIYHDSEEGLGFTETGKTANFTKSFNTYKKEHPTLSDKSPEEILAYIYAVLYAPTYRTTYAEDLAYDYPRVPFTQDRDVFDKLATLGQKLITLHLMKDSTLNAMMKHGYPIAGDNTVGTPRWQDNKLYINDTQHFINVSQDVYNYTIGGYQVLDKWLKSRKETNLSTQDIDHLQNVIAILDTTITLQQDIEKIYKGLGF